MRINSIDRRRKSYHRPNWEGRFRMVRGRTVCSRLFGRKIIQLFIGCFIFWCFRAEFLIQESLLNPQWKCSLLTTNSPKLREGTTGISENNALSAGNELNRYFFFFYQPRRSDCKYRTLFPSLCGCKYKYYSPAIYIYVDIIYVMRARPRIHFAQYDKLCNGDKLLQQTDIYLYSLAYNMQPNIRNERMWKNVYIQ